MEGSCIVVDIGSGSLKAEFAGAEVPKVFQNVVGTVKHTASLPQQQLPGLINGSMFVGGDVAQHRGLLRLTHPMTHGHVTEWDGMAKMMQHVAGALGVEQKDHPILVTEPATTSRPQRLRLAEILFEQLDHPAALFSVQPLLSLYSTGNTTGVVLDVGDGVSQAMAIFEGYSVREATRRVDFGGRDVTAHLQLLLRQHGTFLDTSAEFDIVREVKEQKCTVAAVRTVFDEKKDARFTRKPQTRFKLPDGSEVSVDTQELNFAPEALFTPALVGSECSGVVQLVNECVRRCDIDMRSQLFGSIYLAGGSTMMSGFCPRYIQDITKLAPHNCKLRVVAPAERRFTTWIGGSFLAQLSSFSQLLTQRSEYSEQGERVLHERLFC